MDWRQIEAGAKTEALGWVELSEDPVPITWAGCKRTLKRAALAFIPVAAVFGALWIAKLLDLLPVHGG